MKVLVITGDPSFKAGNPRFDLQSSAVERLDVFAHWGFLSGPIGFFKVLFAALRTRYDVITSQEPFFRGILAVIAARLSGTRSNIQVHADIDAQSFIKHMLAQIVLRHADSVRVVSEKIEARVQRIAPHARISVLPVFVDLERFKNIERHPDDKPLMLWIGRFENEKDPLTAIEIFTKVRQEIPEVRLVMLGSGSLEEKLKFKAKGLSVEFPGWQDPLPFLERAHAVISTSRAESWGVSIVEALAAAVPVVAPDVGIAREAGAVVVTRERLADALTETLRTCPKAELKLPVLAQEAWVEAWKKTLI